MVVELKGIDPDATYEVSSSRGYEEAPKTEMAGRQLTQLSVSISDVPGSVLLRYAQIARDR